MERLEKELGEADRLAAKFKEIALKADAEFKAELDETFKQVEGEKVRLGDVCEFRRGLTYTKADEVKESSKVVLRSNNIDLNTGKLAFEELKCLREDFQVPREKYVFANTILMCMANGSKQHLGKVAFIADDLNYAFGGFMGLLVPHGIDAKYFYMTLTAQQFREHIKGLQAGANINNLKFSDLENYPVTMPPLDMQAKIVAKLDAAKEKCAQLKAAAERGLKAAEDLRKAILAEAFQTEKVE